MDEANKEQAVSDLNKKQVSAYIEQEVRGHIFKTVSDLRELRSTIVLEGNAKLLDSFDSVLKNKEKELENYPKSESSNLFVLIGFVVFIGPWAYGLYKIFA